MKTVGLAISIRPAADSKLPPLEPELVTSSGTVSKMLLPETKKLRLSYFVAVYQPVGALLCTSKIADTLRSHSGYFQHGHTFMGHASAVAAALATQKIITGEGLLENVLERGKAIRTQLRKSLASHPHVGDVRGRGMLIGVEFVADRETKEPFDPSRRIHNKIQQAAMQNGLLCYAMGGTIDGRRGDHILIAPPYNLGAVDHEELVEKFVLTVNSTSMAG